MGNCIGGVMSNVIYFSEKFAMFLSFTSLITCAILCMVCMLAFGIGLGYNYSFVDTKTKHVYVGAHYRKVRPPSYSGPGYYKPSTLHPSLTKRKKKTTQRWMGRRALTQSEEQEPKVVAFVPDVPEELPHLSPAAEYLERVDWDGLIKFKKGPNRLVNMYFSTPTSTNKLRFNSFSLSPQNESTTEMAKYYVGNKTKVEQYIITEQEGKASNNSGSNATKPLKEIEPITVNVTKTHDNAPPIVLKTLMHQNQLMKWLTRLQDANKTFAVHVITN